MTDNRELEKKINEAAEDVADIFMPQWNVLDDEQRAGMVAFLANRLRKHFAPLQPAEPHRVYHDAKCMTHGLPWPCMDDMGATCKVEPAKDEERKRS